MTERVVIVNADSKENEFTPKFIAAARQAGLDAGSIASKDCAIVVSRYQSVSVIHNGSPISTPGTAFFIKSYKGDAYGTYLMARVLAHQGANVYTDSANIYSANSADKITVTVMLPLSGIRVPASVICTSRSFEANHEYILSLLSFPCVLKKTGSRGKQVFKIMNESELRERLQSDDQATLLQEYIPNDHDFRVFVQDGEILAAIKRSTADGFYNNISQGGTASPTEISAAEKELCIQATKIAELRVSGVDFVRANGQAYVFEVNKNPQLDIFNDAAGFDLERAVGERVINDLLKK